MKSYFFKLENGLQVLIVQDKSKKNGFAELITRFGSKTEGYMLDGERHFVTPGLAHLLEHTIIENSFLGNAANYFKERYVGFNGSTGYQYTRYYISDILDFKKNLVHLIQMVMKPTFDEEKLENIKKPVIEEIRAINDRLFLDIERACYEAVHHYNRRYNHGGSIEDVKGITMDELKQVHRVFYQPFNQFLKISYAGDIEEMKKLIMDAYANLHLEECELKKIVLEEPKTVNKKEMIIPANGKEEMVYVLFKIPKNDFSPKELVRSSFYLSHFLAENFSDGSPLYKEFIEKKYTIYSIERSFEYEDDYIILTIGVFSSYLKEIEEAVLNCIKEKKISEEKFELWKKETMIDILLREEDPIKYLHPYADNILTFDYPYPDTLEDIESFTIEEYRQFLNRLDFGEHAVVARLEKGKDE